MTSFDEAATMRKVCGRLMPPLFAMMFVNSISAVQCSDPETGHYYDDTRRYIDAIEWLSAADCQRIYEDNARVAYPRPSHQLEQQSGTQWQRYESHFESHRLART